MIEDIIKDYAKKAEAELYLKLPSTDCAQKTVCEAMEYSVRAGGKRLRPVIMLMTAKLLGLSDKDVLPFAAALEMIHTYSLIHDDLPAMDNDDLRRGKPTNHIVYGEAMAILAGDGLLNLAAETVSKHSYTVPAQNVLTAISELFSASGTDGMIGGQVMDIESEGKSITLDELKAIHLKKTGRLIRAAGRVACTLAGADEKTMTAITCYCDNLGIAFQIQDDILDVYGDSKELGKMVGSDAANDKSTYVSICGKDEAERLLEEHTRLAIEALDIFENKAEELTALAKYLIKRKN